jgi:hypothetical protein
VIGVRIDDWNESSGVYVEHWLTGVITKFCVKLTADLWGNFRGNCDIRISEKPEKIGIFSINSMVSGPTISLIQRRPIESNKAS